MNLKVILIQFAGDILSRKKHEDCSGIINQAYNQILELVEKKKEIKRYGKGSSHCGEPINLKDVGHNQAIELTLKAMKGER